MKILCSGLLLFALSSCAPASSTPGAKSSPAAPSDSGASSSTYNNLSAVDLNGQTVSLQQHADSPVVVFSFFATWCKPCMKELVQLDKIYEKHQDDGLLVVAVSVDDSDTQGAVAPMMRARGYGFPTWIDRMDKLSGALNPTKTVPFTAILKNGEVIFKHEGYVPGDEKKLATAIDRALSEQ